MIFSLLAKMTSAAISKAKGTLERVRASLLLPLELEQ
jgi:hypothetical protein